ncbi:MAG: hypothetical protein KC910_01400 [Candidatus Eremiobacteraeota bacterium]|nr:hypothetical protein [Candidatus Eremiobacteraeota bacterium]
MVKRISLLMLLLSWAAVAEPSPKDVLEAVLKDPGGYSQMCAMPEPKPRTELPLFGYKRDWRDSWITVENFRKLRAQRVGVVKEVARRLENSLPGLVKKAQAEAIRLKTGKGQTSSQPNLELEYMVLLDLNGVEALPALMHLERKLNEVAIYNLPAKKLEAPDDPPDFYGPGGYLDHVQVLSVISAILRSEQARGIDQLKEPARYDRQHRDQIVALANRFLETTRPENYRAGKAMAKEPTIR